MLGEWRRRRGGGRALSSRAGGSAGVGGLDCGECMLQVWGVCGRGAVEVGGGWILRARVCRLTLL